MRTTRATLPAMVLVFLGALALYTITSAPGILTGDSAELQTVGLLGGIPHATGYPMFVLLGGLFARLGWADPAFRITFMSSFFGAASLAMLVLVLTELGASRRGAVLGALLYGVGFTFWRVSLRAEVYSLGIFLGLLALWQTLRALRSPSLGSSLLAGLLLGLTLAGHLFFILPVAAMGLTLAWHVARSRPQPIGALFLLLAAFLIGTSPYLYFVWADQHHVAINYYELTMRVKNPLGLPQPGFDTTWKRLFWLLTGRNEYPVPRVGIHPGGMLRAMIHSGYVLFLIELGPLALPLAWLGWRRLASSRRGVAWLLLVMFALSVAFSSALQSGAMLMIFLMPAVLTAALFAGLGLDAFLEGLAARRVPAWGVVAIGVAIVVATFLATTTLREFTSAHPLKPSGFHVIEEDPNLKAKAFPSMSDYTMPRRFAESALAAIPESSFVVAGWPEYTTLRYMKLVLGKRTDMTLEPITPESLVLRLEQWQQKHDLARRPFVFISRIPMMEPHEARLDSVAIADGRQIYVQRVPLAN